MDEPLFLKVRLGDAVLYEKDQIGKILTFIGGSRDPVAPTLIQIANIYSGEIRWIQGDKLAKSNNNQKVCFYLPANTATGAAITNKKPL